MTSAILEMRNATKLFGGAPAIDGVNFSLAKGEIHALLGENGAGKSTLTKVMAGVMTLSHGDMYLEGRKVSPRTPAESLALGIGMVFQETSLVPTMTVAQNLFLGREDVFNRLRGTYIAAQQFLQGLNFHVDPGALVNQLGAANKQMVEIARAVLNQAKIIIFDEPTATLTPEEKKYFFDLVLNLKARGVSIIFISHALEEALQLADRITILRDGKLVITDDKQSFDRAKIINHMVGRSLSETLYGVKRSHIRKRGRRVLSVQNLRVGSAVKNNSFSIFAGQVTGVFGLVGAGRTETFKVVAGLLKRDLTHGGEIVLDDRPVRYRVPALAVRDGVAYVTEDRKVEGFFDVMTIDQNLYVAKLGKYGQSFISRTASAALGAEWTRKLAIRAIGSSVKANELSGGNQQKLVIAKSLAQDPELVIFDEPTRGVDVGAIAEIHDVIGRIADEGKAVVVVSSYLPEIRAISDRILVARQGKIVEEFSAKEATDADIMYAAVH